jgi:ferredoxin-thioredoxin reductase catalytic chain
MELTAKDEANLDRARRVGEERGYVLNPDTARALKVANLLVRNHEEFGKYYCPCKQSHPLNPDEDVLCPCLDLDQEVARDGHCFCRLYYSPGQPGGEGKAETESCTGWPGGL